MSGNVTYFHITGPIQGEITVPGDKSISHRAVILGSLARGVSRIINFLPGRDCEATLQAVQQLGVGVNRIAPTELLIRGVGLTGYKEPSGVIDCGNSGTTMRLMSGVLAGQPFYSVLTGDSLLRARPMERIVEPLSVMGAEIWGRNGGRFAPLSIKGKRPLQAQRYLLPVASAQVKSCLLLAGMYARGKTTVVEPYSSRDHTERMLAFFGADVQKENDRATSITANPYLEAREVEVPGDISSAAFFVILALLVPGSQLLIKGVGVNPTRSGLLKVLEHMGAKIRLINRRSVSGEEVADIEVYHSYLRGVEVPADLIPTMIDEIPVLAVAAAFASGTTVIRGVEELRYKETDRLRAIVTELDKAGFAAYTHQDALIIEGDGGTAAAATKEPFDSYGDHRMAMSMAMLDGLSSTRRGVKNMSCTAVSFPGFVGLLQRLGVTVE